jgi:hypothetical protein
MWCVTVSIPKLAQPVKQKIDTFHLLTLLEECVHHLNILKMRYSIPFLGTVEQIRRQKEMDGVRQTVTYK